MVVRGADQRWVTCAQHARKLNSISEFCRFKPWHRSREEGNSPYRDIHLCRCMTDVTGLIHAKGTALFAGRAVAGEGQEHLCKQENYQRGDPQDATQMQQPVR